MRKILRSILFFPSLTKSRILFLLSITLLATFFEGFGVAMLFPVMDFIEKGQSFDALADASRMWFFVVKGFEVLQIPKNLLALMLVVFGLLMIRQVFNYCKTVYSNWLTESVIADMRTLGFQYFAMADIPFYDSHGVGQIVNVLTVDAIRAGSGIFNFFALLASCMIFVLYVGLIFVLSPGMTLFAVGVMACVGVILRSRITKSGQIGEKVSRYNEGISSAIVERLNGMRLLKLSGTEKQEIDFIKELAEKIKLNSFNLGRIMARMEFTVDPMVILAGLAILYFSVQVFHMTLAKTGIFIFVLLRLMPYTKNIFNSRQALAGFSGSLFRVRDLLLKAKEASVIKGGNVREIQLKRGIRFENVHFFYDNRDGFALTDLNLFIPAGEMTALVGRSGAGKSTLVDLIPRLRVPLKGRIFMDEVPIEDFDLGLLRKAIAFVSQEGFLFNDTIEKNIRYVRPEATQEEMISASRMAYADPFIGEFPQGYQTIVGERGLRLSGGQKQRIILARALLQRASIIILDEPTSSLDSESEQYIQKALEQIRSEQKVTLIVIAHRLSTTKSSDQIVVLDQGRVIESGSHTELMHEASWYADMIRMQSVS